MGQTIAFGGKPIHLVGDRQPEVGDTAPDVTLTKTDMEPLKLSDLRGKTVVLSVTPSLDTSVCANMCRRFDQEAARLSDDIVVVNISEDLPPAIKRLCGSENIAKIITTSDYRDREFGQKYGVLMDELRLLARSVWVIDREGKIVYKQVMDEGTNEPDYDKAIEAAKQAVGA